MKFGKNFVVSYDSKRTIESCTSKVALTLMACLVLRKFEGKWKGEK